MTAEFAYLATEDPIREDLAQAHRDAWNHVAAPGTWLTGAERVAVGEETRRARRCSLCAERKAALSPFAIDGEHEDAGVLSAAMVDEIHRVTTDAGRLTRTWHEELLAAGLSAESYVEALGVAVLVISIDEFHQALGLPFAVLPEPLPGEPSRVRPRGATMQGAWVPMVDLKQADAEQRRLLAGPGGRSAQVILALSLVPEQVRAWTSLANAQYLSREDMVRLDTTGRALDRSQIELIAARVSALNECFY